MSRILACALAFVLACLPGMAPWAGAVERSGPAVHAAPTPAIHGAPSLPRLDVKTLPAGVPGPAAAGLSGPARPVRAASAALATTASAQAAETATDTVEASLAADMARVDAASSEDGRRESLDAIYLRARSLASDAAPQAGTSAWPAAPRRAPALPPSGPVTGIKRAAVPLLLGIASIWGVDAATKHFAVSHMNTAFHEASWRLPLLSFVVPYITFAAYQARKLLPERHSSWSWSPKLWRNGRLGFYRLEIAGANELAREHDGVGTMAQLYDVSIALMLGGALGNYIDLARLGGALDWIPLGRSLLNFADVALLTGLAFFQLATGFFVAAGQAHASKRALNFNLAGFLGLPLVGFFAAWTFGSSAGGDVLDLAMKNIVWLYVLGFSMLLGVSRVVAAGVFLPFLDKYLRGKPS